VDTLELSDQVDESCSLARLAGDRERSSLALDVDSRGNERAEAAAVHAQRRPRGYEQISPSAFIPRGLGGSNHRISLSPNPSSVSRTRRFALGFVADADVRDVVVLLVSELVTNAVLHGGPHAQAATVDMARTVAADRVRREVEDAGENIPVVGDGALERPTGRPLLLVERLATRWGCEPADVGKVVWVEVAVPAAMTSKGGDRHG